MEPIHYGPKSLRCPLQLHTVRSNALYKPEQPKAYKKLNTTGVLPLKGSHSVMAQQMTPESLRKNV